ncbi:hypothetical protein HAHE_26800 [Haloferula helveola]|uniref:Verru_Chthon cassette protein A n=1 Tax=Haloferula helveola TaxID=490095 RepID=A0ABM7RLT8_9BACT|nr:hypothetical protein HAHE_26800 [Haloferula helveola]
MRSFSSLAKSSRRQGFALVITVTLMLLLTLLAVGLLSLSTISLRASGQSDAMALARSNARMALTIAIGELQKHAGTDKAVTAPIELVEQSPASPRLTGVWSAWDPLSAGDGLAPDYIGAKEDRFGRWMVSDSDPDAVLRKNYGGPKDEKIQLVGEGSLGTNSPDPDDEVFAGRVPVSADDRSAGAYAWHVADESIKARINAYRNPDPDDYLWRKSSLVAGHRPSPLDVRASNGATLDFLPGDTTEAEYREAETLVGKLPTLGQFSLMDGGEPIGPFRHHVTPYSYGLLTSPTHGGLKFDLSSMFEMQSMPGPYRGTRLYETTNGISGPSDPYWSALQSYYDVFKDSSMRSPTPLYYNSPTERVTLDGSNDAPRQFFAGPVIARVEMLFSVVVREAHGPWSQQSTGLPQGTRMIHLLYAPIVTLHNPYNVSIKFDKLDLDINGIPIAFNFYVNGQAQNRDTVPYNQMYVNLNDRAKKSFNISISDWRSFNSDSTSPITMRPGQSLVCGPYIDGNAIFGNAGHEGSRVFFDYSNNLTGNENQRAKCAPGFLGKQVAFDIDWLTPDNAPYSTDNRRGVLIVKPRDRFYIEYQVKPNEWGGRVTDKMTVDAKLKAGRRELEIGGLEFAFDDRSIRRHFPTVYRYPDSRSRPNELTVESLYEPNNKPIRNQTNVRSFALLSARARTANGGVYDYVSRDKLPRGQNLLNDGRLAGNPLLHHNPARTPTVVDLKRDLPGRYSHELNLEPLTGGVEDIYDIDRTNRGYLLTGNTVFNGVKSGSYLELPTGPLQTIADFRRSNALTSSMLPNFVQPVANSYSSPLISTDKYSQSGVVPYPLLDHSVLANNALYNRFYFSTLSNYGTNRTPDKVFASFIDGEQPLAAQSFTPYLPSGRTADKAKSELYSGGRPTEEAYWKAAGYQLVKTPFNVNSVDVQAWKAVLSATRGSAVQQLWATSEKRDEDISDWVPMPSMSLVNGGVVGEFDAAQDGPNIDNQLTNDVNGYRELDPTELEQLATEIVEEIRARGPFLSLSEFVNRRVGPDSAESLAGALQTAIDESGINDNFLAGSVIDVRDADVSDRSVYNFANPVAATGNPAAGASGWLTQGDLMDILEPGATVRGDTFVIRTCGQALDSQGDVRATAYAEAVVQRYPEYVDPRDEAFVNVWDPNGGGRKDTEVNRIFGRRFEIVSFRWLSPEEI